MSATFHPDWTTDCRICGSSPCVVVENHDLPDTELCGPCFFGTAEMLDWELWNDQDDEQQDPTPET